MTSTKTLSYFSHTPHPKSTKPTPPDHSISTLTPDLLTLFISELLFSKQVLQHGNLVELVLQEVTALFMKEQTMLSVESPVVVVGDIHGQIGDLFRVLRMGGLVVDLERRFFELEEGKKLLFMGDYVDRGAFSVEVVMLLFGLKIKYPDRVFLLRGNHELRQMNYSYGFALNCTHVFQRLEMWEYFNQVFDAIPICAVVDERIFCVHGGISPHFQTLEQIQNIDRFDNFDGNDGIRDLLWSDPDDHIDLFTLSPRGAGKLWGESATNHFLQKNNLELIVRAHELQMEGYHWQHSQKVITIFSASNYCYRCGNDAAILSISGTNLEILKYSPCS